MRKTNVNHLLFLLGGLLSLVLPAAAQDGGIPYGSNPEASHYAPVNGIELYYETYGSGAPLLLLHGNGGSIEAFRYQIPFFEKHYQVIAVDSRLQGRSGGSPDTLSYDMMAEDFCALLDYLDLDSVYVLGWSDGGIDGILMALDCPSKVRKLAVSGANTVPDSSALPYADLLYMKDLVENSKTASAKEKTLNRMMLYQPQIPDEELGRITCPVLVMAGDHDLIKAEHTLRIFRSIPGAELCIFPGAHHGVCQQYPAVFNETVLRFFEK
ncbi:MAG: alpha/beta fold hydrolase [Bacteroidota bacterium]